MDLAINKITKTVPIRDHGDIESLKKSIEEVGLINPITLNNEHQLIAGRRRFQAVKELGWKTIPVRLLNSDDFKVTIQENLKRKPLTDPELSIQIKEYDELKRKIYGEQPRGKHQSLPESGNDGWSQEKTGKDLGIRQQAITTAIQIAEAIEEHPNLAKENKGSIIIRKAKAIKDEKRIKEEAPFKKINGKYKTILIDPPWDYKGLNLQSKKKGDGGILPDYKTLTLEEIEKTNPNQYADDNCHLYVWSTNNFIFEALKLIEKWGFNYKTLLTWIKPGMGLGFYFRNTTEHLLFAIKGKMQTRATNILTYFEAPKSKHSKKPDKSYDIIEQSSFPPYLELFSRGHREGWTSSGGAI